MAMMMMRDDIAVVAESLPVVNNGFGRSARAHNMLATGKCQMRSAIGRTDREPWQAHAGRTSPSGMTMELLMKHTLSWLGPGLTRRLDATGRCICSRLSNDVALSRPRSE